MSLRTKLAHRVRNGVLCYYMCVCVLHYSVCVCVCMYVCLAVCFQAVMHIHISAYAAECVLCWAARNGSLNSPGRRTYRKRRPVTQADKVLPIRCQHILTS